MTDAEETTAETIREARYRTECERLPEASIADGPSEWGKAILLPSGPYPSDRWYDPFQRLDIAHFYGLLTPRPSVEQAVISAARAAGWKTFHQHLGGVDPHSQARRTLRHPPEEGPPLLLQMDPFRHGPRTEAVEKTVLDLLVPTKNSLSRAEKFTRQWGALEDPMPEEYAQVSEMFGKVCAYPVLRFLYLAHEMYYACLVADALKSGRDDDVARYACLLRLLIGNRPSLTIVRNDALARGQVADGVRGHVHRMGIIGIYLEDMLDARQLLRVQAHQLVTAVFDIRLQHTHPCFAAIRQPRRGRPRFVPSWQCPDLLAAMWTMLHMMLIGGVQRTLAYCAGCPAPFYKSRRNQRYAPGHYETCRKRLQRMK